MHPPPEFVFHVEKRRTIEAIAIQSMSAERVAATGQCILKNFRDTANAYSSVSHARVLDQLEIGTTDLTYGLLEDHVLRGVFTLGNAVSGEIASFRPDSGVFPGSSVGTYLFNIAAWPSQQKWVDERIANGIGTEFSFMCPKFVQADGALVDECAVNTSVTIFADDCGSVVSGPSFVSVFAADNVDDTLFDSCMWEAGLKQNVDKAVRQIWLKGPGTNSILRGIASCGGQAGGKTFSSEARYLGPYLHSTSSFAPECERRIKAASRSWGYLACFLVLEGPASYEDYSVQVPHFQYSCVWHLSFRDKGIPTKKTRNKHHKKNAEVYCWAPLAKN
jgi:hypothetical protein